MRRRTLHPLDRRAREGHDHLVGPLLPEEGARIKARVFPRVILIGKRVVAIARSWSLEDSAAGMDGARLVSDEDRRRGFLFSFFSIRFTIHAHVHLDNVTTQLALISCPRYTLPLKATDSARIGPTRSQARSGRTDPDDTTNPPFLPCKTRLGTQHHDRDPDHRRTVQTAQLQMWLLQQHECGELPSRKSQRVSHVMFGVWISLFLHRVSRIVVALCVLTRQARYATYRSPPQRCIRE